MFSKTADHLWKAMYACGCVSGHLYALIMVEQQETSNVLSVSSAFEVVYCTHLKLTTSCEGVALWRCGGAPIVDKTSIPKE